MSHATDLSDNRDREENFLIRSICLIGGIVYPLWSFVYQYLLADADDPVARRLAISGLALLNIGLTFFKINRRVLTFILYSSMLVMTIQLGWIAYLNHFHPYYQMGILVLICVTLPFYQSLWGIASYTAMGSLALGLLLYFTSIRELFVFCVAYATVCIVSSYALITRLTLIKKLNTSRELFADSADRIEAINRDVSSIMENISSGIFTIESAEGNIGSQYSKNLEEILGFTINPQLTVLDILETTDLGSDKLDQVKTIIDFIGEDQIEFSLNGHLLPKECQMRRKDGRECFVELDWSSIVHPQSGLLQKILVSIRDVTEVRLLRRQNEDTHRELKLISEIFAIEKRKISPAFNSIKKLLDHCREELVKSDFISKESFLLMFREIHTIKGLARSFNLSTLANTSHNAEDKLSSCRTDPSMISKNLVQEILGQIEACFQDYSHIVTEKFGIPLQSEEIVSLSREEIDWIMEHLRNALASGDTYLLQIQELHDFLIEKSQHSLKAILSELLGSIGNLAQELHKTSPEIVVNDSGLSFQASAHNLLQSVFAHMLRNSLDHGIETPEERRSKGKRAEGLIELTVSEDSSAIHVLMKDDGRGLNLDQIYQKACSKGLLEGNHRPPRETLAQLIFLADFSTSDLVTKVSGRGIGMDAVQAYLKGFGGSIRLEFLDDSQQLAPVCFHIMLPKSLQILQTVNKAA